MSGLDLDTTHLYGELPKVEPPQTPMLSSLVAWDHHADWAVPEASDFEKGSSAYGSVQFEIDVTPGELL